MPSSSISLGARLTAALNASPVVRSTTSSPKSLAKRFLNMLPTGPARSNAPEARDTIVVVSPVFSKYSAIAVACS